MMIQVDEVYVNATRDTIFGESGKYEPFTDNIKKLFRAYQQEFGRCISRVYIDTKTGTKPIGWVFQKRQQYTDSKDTYIREVWVTIHKEET
jgi:hypothetical protein